MNVRQNMHEHFSKVSSCYKDVRTTDIEPVLYISDLLKDAHEIEAVDIGCGDGRYDLLLFRHLKNLSLTCADINMSMLEKTAGYLKKNNVRNFRTLISDFHMRFLGRNAIDCIFTFNAVHHFDLQEFLRRCSDVVKDDGWIFIYTRLRSQNARNIWGRFFPDFKERENRLYEMDAIRNRVREEDSLRLEVTKEFKFRRTGTVDDLLNKARSRHYSTFSLYGDEEFESALMRFRENVERYFKGADCIEWYDENILLVLKPA
jgi:SAM-dependent methyltransferase